MAPPLSSSLWQGSAPSPVPPPVCPSLAAPAHFLSSNFFPSSDLSLCLSCLRVSPTPLLPCLSCLFPALCLILPSHSVSVFLVGLPPVPPCFPVFASFPSAFVSPLSHSPPTFSMSPSASLCVSVSKSLLSPHPFPAPPAPVCCLSLFMSLSLPLVLSTCLAVSAPPRLPLCCSTLQALGHPWAALPCLA